MRKVTRVCSCIGVTALMAISVANVSATETVRDLGDGRALVVNFAGKPPFSRKIVAIESLTAGQLRQLAGETDQARLAQTVNGPRGSLFGAKPPFHKRAAAERVESDVSFARFEEQPATAPSKARRGPPGKSGALRRR